MSGNNVKQKTAWKKPDRGAIKTPRFAYIMEILSLVSFYSGSSIWIINCTIWPGMAGRRSLNLNRAEQELGGRLSRIWEKTPMQRNKSLRFVISRTLFTPISIHSASPLHHVSVLFNLRLFHSSLLPRLIFIGLFPPCLVVLMSICALKPVKPLLFF